MDYNISFTVDVSNLDVTKELLQCVDRHIKNNPVKYKELRDDLGLILLNHVEEEDV